MSVIKRLIGTVDGVNVDFETPTEYVTGSVRYVLNGISYLSDHPVFGFTETPPDALTLDSPPLVGDEVAAYYTELTAEGSPFHPGGNYP